MLSNAIPWLLLEHDIQKNIYKYILKVPNRLFKGKTPHKTLRINKRNKHHKNRVKA